MINLNMIPTFPIKRSLRLGLTALAFAGVVAGCRGASDVGTGAADYVFTDAKVYTVNEKQPWAEAIAIKDNKIVYVGDAAGAAEYVGESTEEIDLDGKMLLPGFVSAHDHLIASTWALKGVNLSDAKSIDEALAMIKEYADANPDEEFIRGVGWSIGNFGGQYPTAADLDKVVPDRPAFILDSGVWQAEKTFREGSAELMTLAAKNGTTTVQVTGIVTPTFKDAKAMQKDFEIAMKVLTEKKNDGSLPLRVFPMPIYKDAKGDIDDFIAFSAKMKQQFNDDMLRVQSVKIHPEGNWSSYGAPFLEPYADKDTSGAFGVSPEQSKEIVAKANQAGLNVIIHTDGDASARAAIDAFEATQKSGYADDRNAIHHLIWVEPSDYQRILDLKIPINSTPSFTTDWANNDEATYRMLGEKRVEERMARYPDLIRDGANVTISADVPSTLPSMQAPLFVVEAAVTMKEPSEQGKSKNFPRTRKGMSVEEAIKAVTINPAWQLKMQDKIGSIEVGKYADLVVLEKNPFEVDPLQLEEIEVLMTMMNGNFTYQGKGEMSQDDKYSTDHYLSPAEMSPAPYK